MNSLFFAMARPLPTQIVITGRVTILSGSPTLQRVKLTQRPSDSGMIGGDVVASTPITNNSYTLTLPASFKPDPTKVYELKVVGANCNQTNAEGKSMIIGQQIVLTAGGHYVQELYAKELLRTYTIKLMATGFGNAPTLNLFVGGRTFIPNNTESPYYFTFSNEDFTDGSLARITASGRTNAGLVSGSTTLTLYYKTYEYTAQILPYDSGINPNPPLPEVMEPAIPSKPALGVNSETTIKADADEIGQ